MGAGFSLKSSLTQIPGVKGKGTHMEMGPQPGWDMVDRWLSWKQLAVSRYHVGGEVCGRH